ncbi:MAG TPA: hypothetical protein PK093_02285 [Phycisphaerae bacterium]|nr:hypothetical protein [Phycisphaerae bacterium]
MPDRSIVTPLSLCRPAKWEFDRRSRQCECRQCEGLNVCPHDELPDENGESEPLCEAGAES